MDNHDKDHHKHHILSPKLGLIIAGSLLFLTFITVWIAQFNFGALNFPIAMAVATLKAFLVFAFFMGLKYDVFENRVIFGTGFIFLAIFIVLTASDLFYRGDVYVKGQFLAEAKSGKTTIENPWVGTDALRARGKEVYASNCVSCHGDQGLGNGPASGALNPKPRNFHETEGWKVGRRATDVFKTLTKGVNTMPAFVSLSPDDRWSLVHYVIAFGPKPEDPSADQIKQLLAETEVREIPIEAAIEMVAEDGKLRKR
jgi:cytochrome c oxidase subunit 4